MKILIIKFRNIGDVLLSTPLIANIRHHYPDSSIDFALNKDCEEMLSLNPNINRLIAYDRDKVKKFGWLKQFIEELKFIRHIRSSCYDMVINLTEGDRGAQLAFFSGAKYKLGFPVRKGLLSKLDIFDKVGNDKKCQHTVEKDLQFITLLGKKIVKKSVDIYWPKTIESEVEHLLKEHTIGAFIHVHPVSRWMFKCWEDDRMASIIDFFQSKEKLNVIVTGSPVKSEMDRIEKILSLCHTNPIDLSGKLTLKHLACLSSKAEMFFGVDTAPMHMAAVNTSVVALFGASEAIKWGPWDNQLGGAYLNNGLQSNGLHQVFGSDNHEIIYLDGIKKTMGMLDIDLNSVLRELDKRA